MPPEPLYVGLDLGTSGARAVVIDASARAVAGGKAALADMGADHRDPDIWWRAVEAALGEALSQVDRARVAAIAVDGTSGTVLPADDAGRPLDRARMYNDACEDRAILDAVAAHAPRTSAAGGATSGLAKALTFRARHPEARILHQADWIAGQLSGVFASDENNALKTGYDPVAGEWPGWIAETGLDPACLPEVHAPGAAVAEVSAAAADAFGLPRGVRVVAGTTDGCASFLATGADRPGEGVTALGTTLTLKILSDRPLHAPEAGIYSHRILGLWLAGGASNTGGNVLLAHFTADRLAELSARIDPETDSGLDYYPLARPGERFPVNDPDMAPRLEPRPDDDAMFLKGLLEGIAGVEALGYARLAELGAPPLVSVRSVGGGAGNAAWSRIRARRLGVPLVAPDSDEAAHGTALLAMRGGA